MTKAQFLAELKRSLGALSEPEKQDILYDYEEHFRIGLDEGKSEEEIARALGNPRAIGKSYRIDALLDTEKEGGVSGFSLLRAVFASLSLTFLNIVFVLGPLIGLAGVLIGLWGLAVSLLCFGLRISLCPLWPCVPRIITNPLLDHAFQFFAGVGIAALGLLASLGMMKLTAWFYLMVAAYVKFNSRIIRGER